MTEGERAAEAGKAKAELDLTSQHMDTMRAALFERWLATPMDATAHREKLYHAATTVEYVRRALERSVEDGQVLNYQREMAELLAPPKS